MPDGKHSVDCYMACLDMCAFKRVCENAYPKSDEKVKSIFGCTGPAGGMTIKLKEQQTLCETKVCLRLRHGDHRLDGPRSALPSWLIMEAGPGAKRNLRCKLRKIFVNCVGNAVNFYRSGVNWRIQVLCMLFDVDMDVQDI